MVSCGTFVASKLIQGTGSRRNQIFRWLKIQVERGRKGRGEKGENEDRMAVLAFNLLFLWLPVSRSRCSLKSSRGKGRKKKQTKPQNRAFLGPLILYVGEEGCCRLIFFCAMPPIRRERWRKRVGVEPPFDPLGPKSRRLLKAGGSSPEKWGKKGGREGRGGRKKTEKKRGRP